MYPDQAHSQFISLHSWDDLRPSGVPSPRRANQSGEVGVLYGDDVTPVNCNRCMYDEKKYRF